MKIELELQTGSMGLTFGGNPAAIRKVNPSSPYADVVHANMVVTSVTIPGVMEMTGEGYGGLFLVDLLKAYSDVEGRTIVLEDRPAVDIRDDADATQNIAFWKIQLPSGSIGITFKDCGPMGSACVTKVSDTSPLKHIVTEGVQFQKLSIPGVGTISDVSATRLVDILKANASLEGRVLYLCTKPNETNHQMLQQGHPANLTNEYYVPDMVASCKIEGHEAQMATLRLAPGQRIVAQPGSLVYMSEGVKFSTRIGHVGRWAAGEPLGSTTYSFEPTGDDTVAGTVALAPSFPSKIFAIDLPTYGGTIIAERGAFLFSDETVKLFGYTVGGATGFFSGEGLIMQRITGKGKAFINADGVLIQRQLKAGEKIRVSSGNIAAYQFGVKLKLERVKGFANIFFSGEGLFMSTLEGPGTVWLESQPWTETAASLAHEG